MKALILVGAALLLVTTPRLSAPLLLVQAAVVAGAVEPAAASHLRYERALRLPPDASGETCAVLDAAAFAHMASRAGDDLRVYREADGAARGADGDAVETPFLFTESGAEPADPQPAAVESVTVHGDTIAFDLAMPHQAYTAVELQIAANNFIAEATVTGSNGASETAKPLGTFTLFDLTSEHLARSTELPLQESRFALLHISMRVHGMTPTAAMIAGALVPPSREAQTLHTVVASTSDVQLKDKGWRTVAVMEMPGHVPVEGVRISLDPSWKGDFLRSVAVQGEAGGGVRETVEGEIWQVTRPPGADGTPAIRSSKMAFDAVLAVNLRSHAKITVSLKNGTDKPLPVRGVELLMRQRMFCFAAVPRARYTLRYGDAALHAPVYNDVALVDADSRPQIAVLGPEEINPAYTVRPLRWQVAKGRSQMFWIGLLAMVTLGGSLALHRVRHERKRG